MAENKAIPDKRWLSHYWEASVTHLKSKKTISAEDLEARVTELKDEIARRHLNGQGAVSLEEELNWRERQLKKAKGE